MVHSVGPLNRLLKKKKMQKILTKNDHCVHQKNLNFIRKTVVGITTIPIAVIVSVKLLTSKQNHKKKEI